MQIFSIPFTNNKQITSKKTPSFKKLDSFANIKQIEGITCACCGEKVLSASKYAEIITKLSKPLHTTMRKGNLNFVKALFPESWKLLIQFTYKYPNKSLDEIMESRVDYDLLKKTIVRKLDKPGIEPQSPQGLELERKITKTFFNILTSGRSNMKESSLVMETVAPLKSLLKGKQLEMFELFENYSKIYPDKTLSEIVKEVYKIHEPRGSKFKEDSLNLIEEQFNAIKKFANNSDVEIIDEINRAQDEIMGLYYKDVDGIQFKGQEIRKIFNKILKKNKCAYLFHDINKHVKNLPITIENIDTFIIDAHDHNYSDAKILLAMFRSVFSSEEKILSLDDKGTNKIGNKIVMCNHCVKLRRNNIFDAFVKLHPEMIENAQKQMNIIVNEILAKNLDGNFRFYPLIIARRLREATVGAIDLNIIDYCKIMLEDSCSKIQDLKIKIMEYKTSLDEKKVLMEQYPSLESDFMREITRITTKIEKNNKQIETEYSLQSHINNYLESRNSEK